MHNYHIYDEITISDFLKKEVIAGFFIGVLSTVGIQLGILGSNTFIALMAFAVIALILLKERKSFGKHGIIGMVLLVLFVLCCVSSALGAPYYELVLIIQILNIAIYPALGFYVFYTLKVRPVPVFIAFLLGASMVGLIVNGYIFSTGAGIRANAIDRIVMSPFTGQEIRATNAAKSIIGLLFVSFFAFQMKNPIAKIALTCFFGVGIIFCVYVGTRGPLVAFTPAFILYFLLNTTRTAKRLINFVYIGLASLGLLLAVSLNSNVRFILEQRLFSRFTFEDLSDVTLSNRVEFWLYGLERGFEKPLGLGYSALEAITGQSSHNTFIELFISFGVHTLAAFLMVLLYFCYCSIKTGVRRFRIHNTNQFPELLLLGSLAYYMVETHLNFSAGLTFSLFAFFGIVCRELDHSLVFRNELNSYHAR